MNDATIVNSVQDVTRINEAIKVSLIIGISSLLLVFVLAILLVFTMRKLKLMTAKYNTFMKGSNGRDLEASILSKYMEIDTIKSNVEYLTNKLNTTGDTLLMAYQKMGIVKYDAFKEMGGKLSFSLALLDDMNTGFILTSVHTNEGCYSYVKEIIKGESFVILSNEERTALEEAKNRKNYLLEA